MKSTSWTWDRDENVVAKIPGKFSMTSADPLMATGVKECFWRPISRVPISQKVVVKSKGNPCNFQENLGW